MMGSRASAMRRCILLVVIAFLFAVGLETTAGAWGVQTPSKNITCGDLSQGIACLIFEQDFVTERSCDGTYTASGGVRRSGRSSFTVGCFGGVPYAATNVRTLGYGKSVTHRGVTCRSTTSGLRCSNRDRHGFFLSRKRGYRF